MYKLSFSLGFFSRFCSQLLTFFSLHIIPRCSFCCCFLFFLFFCTCSAWCFLNLWTLCFGKFLVMWLQMFLLFHSLFFSPNIFITHMLTSFVVILQFLDILFPFISPFPRSLLCCSYWHILKFRDSFLSYVQSTQEPSKGILHFCYCSFEL